MRGIIMKEQKNRKIQFGIIVVLLCMLCIPLVSAASEPGIAIENASESIGIVVDNTPVQIYLNGTVSATEDLYSAYFFRGTGTGRLSMAYMGHMHDHRTCYRQSPLPHGIMGS